MKRQIAKRTSELAAWDLDKGCRNIVNQSSIANRKLKKKIRKQDRKRLDRYFESCYNDDVERGADDDQD